jgi:hypothetical protein
VSVRDPRVDPRRDDVLEGWGRTRGKIVVDNVLLSAAASVVWFRSPRSKRKESLEYFRIQARRATVVHTAVSQEYPVSSTVNGNSPDSKKTGSKAE